MMTSFWRVFRSALQNFWRNIWLSLATTVIMTMTLLIVLFLFLANVFGSELIKNIQQKIDLSVDFNQEVTEQQMQALATQLEARDEVESVVVITSEEAREIFLRNNQDNPYIEESLNELDQNPLPASLYIVAKDPSDYEVIAEQLSAERFKPLIAEVRFEDSRSVIESLITIVSTVENVGLIATLVFAALVMLIMFNTVRLAIYSFREEIDIMHLVGASGWFIRGPFVVESIFIALLGVGLATVLIYPFLNWAAPSLRQFFFAGLVQREPFDIYAYAVSHWFGLLSLQIAVAVSLATVSSLVAIQRYLKR